MYIPKLSLLKVTASQQAKYNLFTGEGSLHQGPISAGSTVDIVARRQESIEVQFLSIHNDSGLANTLTVELDQTSPIIIFRAALAIGESALFENEGWKVYSANGEIK